MWPILLAVAFLPFSASALQTGECDYTKDSFYTGDSYCIKPETTASADFSWPPLFPGNAKFVYAMDGLNSTEMAQVQPIYDEDEDDRKGSFVGFWLEYDEVSLNNTDIQIVTEMVVHYTNVSASVGGGNNGCEDLLGAECIDQLNSTLVNLWSTLESYEFPLRSLEDQNIENITSCPSDFFTKWHLLDPRLETINSGTSFNSLLLAQELPGNETDYSTFDPKTSDDVMPPGNSSFTYARQLYERPIAEQKGHAAIALMMRYPNRDSKDDDAVRNGTTADVSVNFVCAKAPQDEDDEGGDGDGDSAAAMGAVPRGLLPVVALVLTIAFGGLGAW